MALLQVIASDPLKQQTGRTDSGSPRRKKTLLSTDQALRERRRLISTPAPNSTNATLLGSGTAVASIWNVSARMVPPPGPSEYNPKPVMLPPGRSDPKTLPTERVMPGV